MAFTVKHSVRTAAIAQPQSSKIDTLIYVQLLLIRLGLLIALTETYYSINFLIQKKVTFTIKVTLLLAIKIQVVTTPLLGTDFVLY